VARDVIPFLANPPDLVGLSHWKSDIPIADALDDVQRHTGLPRDRIYVDEFGAEERYPGRQYEKITQWGNEALQWGCRMAFVWVWKQWHTGPNLGLFEQDDDGSPTDVPTSGLSGVLQLQSDWEVE
jgi:hypothetical protein